MLYDYYKHQIDGEHWHLIRVSNDLSLSIALESSFKKDITDKNGPGTVVPVRREPNGVYVGYIPTLTVLRDVMDEFAWDTRSWGNEPLKLQLVKELLYSSRWSRTSEANGSVLEFRFSNGILYVDGKPLNHNYEIIERDDFLWIISSMVKYKIIDINQYYLTLHDGRFVFILARVA